MLIGIMTDLLKLLESSDPNAVEESKQKFHEQFNLVKESWLVNGLYEYYLSTNSTRSMEILVNVREPHHTYLFDKITDSIKGSKHEVKVQGLTLLGHVVRREPAWLYKITQHTLMKDLLKLLKSENDVLTLLSALMALIVLLPIIPSLMGNYLQDVFEIFSRLAAWNCNNTGKVLEEQMVHLQMALYALFQRLYGMYPCNFLAYLRDQYRNKDLSPIFTHTIKPMLDTVKMHPHLVTTSKTNETTTERWKKMGAHDIIVECERYSLDVPDRCSHESCFITTSRSRSSTVTSSSYVESPYQLQLLKNTQMSVTNFTSDRDFFSPSTILHCQTPPVNETSMPTPIPHSHFQTSVQTTMISSVSHMSQESSSPPEAAIEATPETTPIRDIRLTSRMHPQSTSVARALTSFNARTRSIGSGNNTPTHSQPSSPMRKEMSPFNFPPDSRYPSAFGNPKSNQRSIYKLVQDRSQMSDIGITELSARSKTPLLAPTSPLKIIPSPDFPIPNSPLPSQRIDSPLSQEDEEVLSIVGHGDITQQAGLRHCDSVLHEVEGFRGNEDDAENCEQEHGSPCTAGGLHMPNSRSMNDFVKRVRRLRYHSQCAGESEKCEISTGSSPGNAVSFPNNLTVRRANSCPEMKKSPIAPTKDNISKTLDETDEESNMECVETSYSNGLDVCEKKLKAEKITKLTTSETQTENFWPMPYEHLFLGIFPSLENNEVKPSPSQSPAPLILSQEKTQSATVYDILDRFIETAVHSTEKETIRHLKDQLQLLHQQLLFERHRREIHAFRNRRLLADARNTRALEEHNSALRDQVQLKQKDIDSLQEHLELLRKEKHANETEASVKYWDTQCINLHEECRTLKAVNEDLQTEITYLRAKFTELDNKWQTTESSLLNASAEVKIAKEQAVAGEKGRVELEQANREILLLGELLLKYQERVNELPFLKKIEMNRLAEAYKHEVRVLNQQLESKTANLETCRTRISELENIVQHHDDSSSVQKRMLNEVKEECHEKIIAVESKYQTQLAVNRYLEEKILELWQRIEISAKKAIYSPDTSSCHEVNATVTDRTSTATGVSPHSSPLSASLASSDGSMAFMIPDVKDMKNLQVIVDQKEPTSVKPMEESIQTTNDTNSAKQPSSSSTKYD